ncbi:MAG: hydroxymethylbilane synthase [Ornithinimicrobium sp.]|uniref:hydroxymethylbilane synthase n=1 Tax=Ornithinimicrobium sp. TaxID=1977084 RepID=UPI0026E0FFBB|nr:hydroxymethylbilane synthase [Ornithinimicrobium sp.]MDO5739227.1 hydroxymethylbilane synthase [Ornithinimicrobium sp.]
MTAPPALRLGTRASALATSQSEWVADRLRATGIEVDLVHVHTEGDTNRASLSEIGGTGVFASALRVALRAGDIDLAVHSLKDLPTAPEHGLLIAAVPQREDPHDALVARDGLRLHALPGGARVGTGSARRAAQLRQLRPDLTIQDIRGNVGTRIGYVRDGDLDAVVLACAGLSRLGRLDEVAERLPIEGMLPAPGQGALAVECREEDADLRQVLASVLEHEPTRRAVDAERAVLRRLGAGCTAPVAAWARLIEGSDALTLSVFVMLQDQPQRHVATGFDPAALGHDVAEHLLSRLDPVQHSGTGPAAAFTTRSHTTGA